MINMAILKQRLNRKNSSGGYDTIYLETIATVVKMSESDSTTVAAAINNRLPLSGGTLTGNLEGKYITGTWLKTTDVTDKAGDIATIDSEGWIYKRTPAEIRSDIGAAKTDHTHETSFSIIASNEMNLVNGYNDDNGRGDVYFNVSGANKPIKDYGFMNGKGAILGICTHTGNINTQVKTTLAHDTLGLASLELNQGINNSIGGYIDFHYAGTTGDYTSRIIESANGRLSLQNTNGTSTTDSTPAYPLLRNIECHTTDITPKTTTLTTGRIYVVYE